MEVTTIFGLHITYLPPLHPGSSEPLAYLLTPRRHRQCNGCNGLLWLTVLTIHTGYWSQLAPSSHPAGTQLAVGVVQLECSLNARPRNHVLGSVEEVLGLEGIGDAVCVSE